MAYGRRDQDRVKMRCKLTLKHWNEMMENLDQIVMEGGWECEDYLKKLRGMAEGFGNAVRKSYNYNPYA